MTKLNPDQEILLDYLEEDPESFFFLLVDLELGNELVPDEPYDAYNRLSQKERFEVIKVLVDKELTY